MPSIFIRLTFQIVCALKHFIFTTVAVKYVLAKIGSPTFLAGNVLHSVWMNLISYTRRHHFHLHQLGSLSRPLFLFLFLFDNHQLVHPFPFSLLHFNPLTEWVLGETLGTIQQRKNWAVWGVQIQMVPMTSGGSTPLGGQKHRFSSDIHPSPMAPRSFLSHTLATASAGGRNLVRGWLIRL